MPGTQMSRLAPRPFTPSDEVLGRIDAVFLSTEDLAGFGDPGLLERLKTHIPVVAVTDGANGATVYDKGTAFHVGTLDVDAVDPTGAGDTFAAACLLALGAGASSPDAAMLGAAAAAKVVQGVGPATMDLVPYAIGDVCDIRVSYHHR